ncbi:(2Fe-2S)-binding protein [Hoeflea sp. TYP-13]|uniref:(2Fe-2S)-binding protein n=1 Tax=Hoeflea sp. TYP-13 TaxID=3230023 RepID=UPI0034C63207
MITCQCNIITEAEIEETIVSMLDEDRWQLIVPAKVYHALEKRGKCCRCFPNVVDIIIRTTDAYHARFDTPDADMISYRAKLIELRNQYAGGLHEGQRKGNRAA